MKTGHSRTSWTELEPVLSDCLWQVQSCGVVVAFSAQICGTVLFSHLSSVSLRMMGCGSVWQGRCYTEPAVCFQSPSVCWQILKWKPLSTTKKCTLAAWCQTAAVLSSASETVLYRWLETNLDMCACPHTHTHTIIPKHTHTHTHSRSSVKSHPECVLRPSGRLLAVAAATGRQSRAQPRRHRLPSSARPSDFNLNRRDRKKNKAKEIKNKTRRQLPVRTIQPQRVFLPLISSNWAFQLHRSGIVSEHRRVTAGKMTPQNH